MHVKINTNTHIRNAHYQISKIKRILRLKVEATQRCPPKSTKPDRKVRVRMSMQDNIRDAERDHEMNALV